MAADWSLGAIARDMGTGMAAWVPGPWGDGARAEVARRTEHIGGPGRVALDIVGPPTTNAQAVGGIALSAIPGGRAAGAGTRVATRAAAGGERMALNFGRSASRVAPRLAPATRTATRTAPRWVKPALIGTGVAAYGYDVASSLGKPGNPLVPDPLEHTWNAAGDTAKAVGDSAKWLLPVGVGIAALVLLPGLLGKR